MFGCIPLTFGRHESGNGRLRDILFSHCTFRFNKAKKPEAKTPELELECTDLPVTIIPSDMIHKSNPDRIGISDFPGEIRNQIYLYLSEPQDTEALLKVIGEEHMLNPAANMLLSCRKVYHEFRLLARPNYLSSYSLLENPHTLAMKNCPLPLSTIRTLIIQEHWQVVKTFWSNSNASVLTTNIDLCNVENIIIQLCLCGARSDIAIAWKVAHAMMSILDSSTYQSLQKVTLYICGCRLSRYSLSAAYRSQLLKLIVNIFNQASPRIFHGTLQYALPTPFSQFLATGIQDYKGAVTLPNTPKATLERSSSDSLRSITLDLLDSMQACGTGCVFDTSSTYQHPMYDASRTIKD
ncbi:uncharacterized protein PV09_02901 [Verruconis gallopava]|uniref:F-box domain-containing protein n=1 Tax=Verruconis gallopava TaxID=253628 RepID=A0A0D2B5H0_9PEZI|nr:uncharacterized protein PV09_02901 [Verruconis gallopava]KIW06459.1 hypothetical protein PV09_02901 [Verruconis gallopava]